MGTRSKELEHSTCPAGAGGWPSHWPLLRDGGDPRAFIRAFEKLWKENPEEFDLWVQRSGGLGILLEAEAWLADQIAREARAEAKELAAKAEELMAKANEATARAAEARAIKQGNTITGTGTMARPAGPHTPAAYSPPQPICYYHLPPVQPKAAVLPMEFTAWGSVAVRGPPPVSFHEEGWYPLLWEWDVQEGVWRVRGATQDCWMRCVSGFWFGLWGLAGGK
ncbi:unnamed protein product [Vitrella brassicaformis CCMP3155]|uniref:Uncharacterized protein n=1 Tax=Vitrella brassicaformis (strain CCMP3155) TaxID=1169540 RepID=A0A0G4EAY7_VITBC|nr:unnamed protein product [Vitrella brassicaformis CCMP3155]|eukprot:CEL92828.1 unnamed protein product [Vitrella brassicaformis CCMP3155]